MPERKPSTDELTQEIATVERDTTRAISYGGVLENLDDTLRTRGAAKGLKIYDEIERDCHVYAVMQKRKLAVVSRPWRVDPASDSARDVEAAQLVRAQLEALNFDQLTYELLDAVLKGFAVSEVMWAVRGPELVAERTIARDQRRFVFDSQRQLRMLTPERVLDGVELPPMKFIVHRFGAKDGSPYGFGLGSRLFWPTFFKRKDISFWLVFADKFGSPTGLGKYPPSAPKADQEKLLDALRSIAQDAGIIVPQGMEIELLEAARQGSIDTYEKLARYMDEQITLCVLGETITTSARSTGLGSGVAEKQSEVRIEIAQSDADLLSATLNGSLVRWIVDLNVPGAGYPTVWRVFEDEEDLEKRATVDEKLHAMGYEPESIEYINETYGGKWRKRGQTLPAAAPAQFAEQRTRPQFADQRALDGALDTLEAATLQEQAEKMVEPALAVARKGADYDTIARSLAEAYPQMDSAAFEDALARALFVADLWGRVNARDPRNDRD